VKLSAAIEGDLAALLAEEAKRAERAATFAIREAGKGLQDELREQVTAAGLGRRLANAVRLKLYPERGDSIDAAAFVYARPGKGRRGGAADIVAAFEEGTLIRRSGGRFLAIPTENVPTKPGTRRRMTPGEVQDATKFGGFGRDLEAVPTNRPGVLLLVLPVIRGARGPRPVTVRRVKAGRQVEWLAMFILVRQAQMPRLLDWKRPTESWGARLPQLVIGHWDRAKQA
jgi:hypothetical protein